MSVRMYQDDPYNSSFEAKVIKVEGDWVTLDRTCFYPGGGGQDPDTGTIADVRVTEVKSDGDSVKHRMPGQALAVGQSVVGMIDWERRLDLMRGHSGEHLLFGTLQRMVERLELVKIAITPEKKSVMVRGQIDWPILEETQRRVNEVIATGLTSEEVWVDRESPLLEQARVKLDRIHGDRIRLVKFGEYDIAACSGIHVKNTSEIGMLLVTGFTSAKPVADYEIEFEVGRRAMTTALGLSSLALKATVLMGATPETMLNSMINQKEDLARLKELLRKNVRETLVKLQPYDVQGMKVYSGVFEGIEKKLLMDAANSFIREDSALCILAAEGEKLILIVAANENLGLDCSVLLNQILKGVAGKGGGSKTFATGGANVQGQGARLIAEALDMVKASSHR